MRHDRTCQSGFERQRHPAPALHHCYWVGLCLCLLVAACSTSPAPSFGTPTSSGSAQPTPITAYHGHTSTIFAVAWSPDGRRLASASLDGSIQMWEVASGKQLFSSGSTPTPEWAVAWSPSGHCLAAATGNTNEEQRRESLQVWSTTSRQLLISYPVPSSASLAYADGTLSLTWSPDGTQLASGGADMLVHLWNALPFCSGQGTRKIAGASVRL